MEGLQSILKPYAHMLCPFYPLHSDTVITVLKQILHWWERRSVTPI